MHKTLMHTGEGHSFNKNIDSIESTPTATASCNGPTPSSSSSSSKRKRENAYLQSIKELSYVEQTWVGRSAFSTIRLTVKLTEDCCCGQKKKMFLYQSTSETEDNFFARAHSNVLRHSAPGHTHYTDVFRIMMARAKQKRVVSQEYNTSLLMKSISQLQGRVDALQRELKELRRQNSKMKTKRDEIFASGNLPVVVDQDDESADNDAQSTTRTRKRTVFRVAREVCDLLKYRCKSECGTKVDPTKVGSYLYHPFFIIMSKHIHI